MIDIPCSPTRFSGTLAEFYTQHMISVLLKPDLVQHYHKLLKEYCAQRLGPLLVRHEGIKERGTTYDGRGDAWPITWTDNSPARAIHWLLFHEQQLDLVAFTDFLKTAPCTILEAWTRIPKSVSASGWYIAHINGVKRLVGSAKTCNAEELIARFIRNVHPCNYFYVPRNGSWYGEQQDVIDFVAERYQSRYIDTWMEFLQLVKAEPLTVSKDLREFPVQFAPTEDRNHLAPQAAELVAVLRMSPTVEVYESELRELLIHGKKSGILKTRQDPWRVFRWYRSTLDGPRISGENWPHKLSYKGLEHRIVAVTQNLEKLA